MATSEGGEMVGQTTIGTGSENEFYCSPCNSDENKLCAVGYCVNCREYLCERCYECHTVPSVTRKHVLLDKEHMLTDVESKEKKDSCNRRCPQHDDKGIDYHCSIHSFLGCHVCCFIHQKTCKEVKYIPDISRTFMGTDEYNEFITKLNAIAVKSANIVEKCKHKQNVVETRHAEAISALKQFKKEILDAIDKLEKEIAGKSDKIKEEDTTKLNDVPDKCRVIQTKTQGISKEIEVLQSKNHNCDLYVSMVTTKDSLFPLEDEMQRAESEICIKQYTFNPNKELLETLKGPWGLGKLCLTGTNAKAEHVNDIDVKYGDDQSNCCIRGSALLPGNRMVLADTSNKKLKLLDTKQNKILSEIKLESGPQSVSMITDNLVAVALDKKVVFVRTDPCLNVDREVGVNGTCRSVAYNEGKLVVSFSNPSKVNVIDLQGTVLRSIEIDSKGQQMFKDPYAVAINPTNNLIYVSEYDAQKVVCMSFDGIVVSTYSDNDLEYPQQAVFDSSGMVYVCGYTSQNIHQITEDCKKVKVLLTSADGLGNIETICFSETDSKLYVGHSGNIVKVYRVSFSTL